MTRRELLAMPAVALLPAPKPVSPGRYGTLRFRPARSVRIVFDADGNRYDELNPPGWGEPYDIHVFLDGAEIEGVMRADEATGELERYVYDADGRILVDYVVDDGQVVRANGSWSCWVPGDDREYVNFDDDPTPRLYVSCDVATEVLRGRVTLLTTAEIAAGSGPVLS